MSALEEVLSKKSGDIKAAPPLPVGKYLMVVCSRHEFGKSSQKQTDYVDFPVKIIQIGDDVNQDEVAAYTRDFGPLMQKELKGRGWARFFLTEAALTMVKEFLTNGLGIDDNGGEKSLKEMFNEAPGKQFWMEVRQLPSQDGKRMISEMAGYVRV